MSQSRFLQLVLLFTPLVLGMMSGRLCDIKNIDMSPIDPIKPPNWTFGVVWTILYLLLGYILKETWFMKASTQKNILMLLLFSNLMFNVSWTPVFACKSKRKALILLVFTVLTAIGMWSVLLKSNLDWTVSLAVVPYVVWLLYALIMNVLIVNSKPKPPPKF